MWDSFQELSKPISAEEYFSSHGRDQGVGAAAAEAASHFPLYLPLIFAEQVRCNHFLNNIAAKALLQEEKRSLIESRGKAGQEAHEAKLITISYGWPTIFEQKRLDRAESKAARAEFTAPVPIRGGALGSQGKEFAVKKDN
ncbi:hypothetical protein Dimus_037161 [Dionaea muscipula]